MAQKAILLKDSLLLNLEQNPDGILANQLKVFKDCLKIKIISLNL